MAGQREAVLLLARDAVLRGQGLGRDPERVGVAQRLHPRVHQSPAQGGVLEGCGAGRIGPSGLRHHPRRAAHGLDATPDRELRVTGHHGARCLSDRLEARAAEPVDGRSGHLLREPRQQRRHARHIAVVLPGLVRAAEEDLVERGRIDLGAVDDRAQHVGGQVIGANPGEDTAVSSERTADSSHDHRLGRHAVTSVRASTYGADV